MNIATLQGETTIDALAQRIFGDAAKKQPELAARLLEANPHLQTLSTLPPGTPLVVPQTGDPQIDATAAAVDPRRQAAIEEFKSAIDDLEISGNAALARREAELTESVRLANLPDLRKAVGGNVITQLDTIVKDGQAQIQQVAADRQALAAIVQSARSTLQLPPPRRRAAGK